MPINWCTSCKVGLANEEVVNGVCERCGAPVVRKVKSEWMLKITDYAEKLLEGLNDVDYIERVKVSQKNWIGKSQGAEVDFAIAGKRTNSVFIRHAAIHYLVLLTWLYLRSIRSLINIKTS